MIKQIEALFENWFNRIEDTLINKLRVVVREELEGYLDSHPDVNPSTTPSTPAVVTPEPPSPAPVPTPAPTASQKPSDGSWSPFEGLTASDLYVQNGVVAKWCVANPTDPNAKLLHDCIAVNPTGTWLVYDNKLSLEQNKANVVQLIQDTYKAAGTELPVFVIYGVKNRDDGGQSSGGALTLDDYKGWIGAIGWAIHSNGSPKTVAILEPDALLQGWHDQEWDKLSAIQIAVDELAYNPDVANPNLAIYIDAAMWDSPSVDSVVAAINFLKQSDKMKPVRGWSLNTSGYNTDDMCHSFGEALVERVGGHYIVDTSRNGHGPAPANQWENVPGMKLGVPPLHYTPTATCDGNLWIKPSGESDGADNGAPKAGQFNYKTAVELSS